MLQLKQKDESAKIKCKACVEKAQAQERAAAAEKAAAKSAAAGATEVLDVSDGDAAAVKAEHDCAACGRRLGAAAFNKTQLSKGPGKQRCRDCVEAAEKREAGANAEKKDARIEEARAALAAAEISGDPREVLKASSTLSALEGEKVTGLKPVVLGRGRGRGRGQWRGGKGSK